MTGRLCWQLAPRLPQPYQFRGRFGLKETALAEDQEVKGVFQSFLALRTLCFAFVHQSLWFDERPLEGDYFLSLRESLSKFLCSVCAKKQATVASMSKWFQKWHLPRSASLHFLLFTFYPYKTCIMHNMSVHIHTVHSYEITCKRESMVEKT